MKLYAHHIPVFIILFAISSLFLSKETPTQKKKHIDQATIKKEIKRQTAHIRNKMDRRFLVVFKKRVERQAQQFPASYFLESLSNKKRIALTFDDGPYPVITRKVLMVLKKHNVKATFFMYGKAIRAFPWLVKKAKKEGHAIGIHSYSHKRMNYMSSYRLYIKEIQTVQNMLQRLTGKKSNLYRPPYGIVTDSQVRYLAKKGIKVVNWSIDSFDWRPGYNKKKKIVKTVMTHAHPGAIVLMHDACGYYCRIHEVIDEIVPKLKKKGYTFCTVEELLQL